MAVEADAVRANKLGVVEMLGEHHISHGAHHGGVGAGTDGDPLVGEGGGAERVARVDADDARAGLTGQLEEVIAVGAVAHLGGIPTPHQDVFGIEPVLPLIAGDERAIDGGRGEIDGAPRIGVVDAQAAAEEIHQAAGDVRAIELVVGAGAIGNEQRGVAVPVLDALHFAGKAVERLVPGDGRELALAAFADALERSRETVGVVLAAEIGTAAHAGAQLRRGEGIGAVICVEADDATGLDVGDQHATPAAVVGGAADADPGYRRRGLGGFCLFPGGEETHASSVGLRHPER